MHKELIVKFYEAFSKLDSETMVSCYHEDVVFEDPAFGTLKGERAGSMWKMLCKNSTDLIIDLSNVEVSSNKGKAHWDAAYTFSKTGRKVLNSIDAEFEFKGGKIIKHTDYFDLHTWAKQAMGFKGLLLGGTSFFKKKLNKQTNYLLDKFIENS